MKTNKLTIEECGLQLNESRDLIFKMLNNQIEMCKLNYISEWEKDHSISADIKNQKIEALRAKKEEVAAFFNECAGGNPKMDLHISFEFKVKEPARELEMA
jgi:hypothetical protein